MEPPRGYWKDCADKIVQDATFSLVTLNMDAIWKDFFLAGKNYWEEENSLASVCLSTVKLQDQCRLLHLRKLPLSPPPSSQLPLRFDI